MIKIDALWLAYGFIAAVYAILGALIWLAWGHWLVWVPIAIAVAITLGIALFTWAASQWSM